MRSDWVKIDYLGKAWFKAERVSIKRIPNSEGDWKVTLESNNYCRSFRFKTEAEAQAWAVDFMQKGISIEG